MISGTLGAALLAPAPFFIMRTPLLSVDHWFAWGACVSDTGATNSSSGGAPDQHLLWERLRDVFALPVVRQALYIAAPRVEAELSALDGSGERPDAKLLRTLVRYFARMTGRATPFGMFGGCSLGRLGSTTRLTIEAAETYRTFTTLDFAYLCSLTELVRPVVRRSQTTQVRVNETLYEAANGLRFVEVRTQPESLTRTYHLVSMQATAAINLVIGFAHHPIPVGELAERLCRSEKTLEFQTALAFVRGLVETQILVDTIEPNVTGCDPLMDTAARLGSTDHDESRTIAGALSATEFRLRAQDARAIGIPPAAYRELAAALPSGAGEASATQHFHVDIFKPGADLCLGAEMAALLSEAALLLHRVSPCTEPAELIQFRGDFERRYEGCEIPLLEVLDPEIGIGFGDEPASNWRQSAWLSNLEIVDAAGAQGGWSSREAHLLKRVFETTQAGLKELSLTADDIAALASGARLDLPRFFAVLATLVAGNPEQIDREASVLITGLCGPSGSELIGRFCHGDRNLAAQVTDWFARQHRIGGALPAEIVHLPQARIGNIISRPVLRDYEIVCLGGSGVDHERAIPLSDLTVRLVGSRVTLRSKRLNCDIVPRLACAHVAPTADLVHYRFLCALQQQEMTGLSWDWGNLAGVPFLPRVTHGRVILSRATWRIDAADLSDLRSAKHETRTSMHRLRDRHQLPRYVMLVNGEMTLPVDLDNPLCAELLAAESRSGPVTLCEQLPGSDQMCANGPEGHFAHELIVPLERTDSPEPPARASAARPWQGRPPAHLPGGDWISVELVARESMLDPLLAGVGSLAAALRDADIIDRWFFVRFWDPVPHIRLRFRGKPERLRSEAWPALLDAVGHGQTQGMIHRIRLETYVPEINRYGGPEAVDEAEAFFEADSTMALALMQLDQGEGDFRERTALMASHALLCDFMLDAAGREEFATERATDLSAETHIERNPIGRLFRELRSDLESLVGGSPELLPAPLREARPVIAARSQAAAKYYAWCRGLEAEGKLTSPLRSILASLIHMQLFRLARVAPPLLELVIYDVLRRHYRAGRAKGGLA